MRFFRDRIFPEDLISIQVQTAKITAAFVVMKTKEELCAEFARFSLSYKTSHLHYKFITYQSEIINKSTSDLHYKVMYKFHDLYSM